MKVDGHVKLYIQRHGSYQTSAERLDHLIATYLPASVEELRSKLQHFSDTEHGAGIDYSDLRTVTECLMVLAELHGYATN